ncbi:MAG: Gldg family protein [Phycisphaerales bacterium]|jgi:ABC-2 type transport system permease protein|nr:Gldg family protein [Phycisphaerales bacterium]
MRRTLVIAWRELKAFFLSPAGWIVPALFLFSSGLVFMQAVFHAGHPASLRAVMGFNAIFLLVAAPAIVMGSVCEARRRGTLALLQASPARSWEIMLGMWLGGVGVMVALLAPTLLQVLALEWYGRPDLGAIACGYLGLLLLGGAVLASGLLASALVGSQAVAFLVTCIGWVLVSVVLEVGLPKVTPPTWHATLAGIDPLQRLQDFTVGLLDSANVIYFVLILTAFLVAAAAAIRVGCSRAASSLGVLGMFAVVVGLASIAAHPSLRGHIDATKSRAYSLSPQTAAMLDDIDEPWRIAVLLVEDQADPAMLRQVDEVLHRFEAAADSVHVERIDPTAPDSLAAWESLRSDLRDRDAAAAAAWSDAIAEGTSALESLIFFARRAAGPVRSVAEGDVLETGAATLAVLAAQGDRIVTKVETLITTGPERPLPEWSAARSVLVQALTQWGSELDGIARALLGRDGDLPSTVGARAFHQEAARLSLAADTLARLAPLASADHGRHLLGGEAAVIIGPGGSRVIPGAQLVPNSMAAAGSGRVAFDQRFRGEQLIAAAMRSIKDGLRPRVVFMHDEETSVVAPGRPERDVSGVASMLEAAGWTVQEWQPHVTPSPASWSAGPTAWVVLPSVGRGRLEARASESALLRAAHELLASGQGVMINLFPSPGVELGQADPWAALAASVGVQADTGSVLLRDVSPPGVAAPPEAAIELTDFPASHPVAAALHGQSLLLPMAVPLVPPGDEAALGSMPPAGDVWLEPHWQPLVSVDRRMRRRTPQFDSEAVPDRAVPLLAARSLPSGARAIVVGSGGWMRTGIADAAASAGGDRVSLVHPGNHELMLAGTAWLAGLDDRIARGALSQEVARLGSVPAGSRTIWGWVLLAGLPGVSLLLGLGIWSWRRT